MTEKIFIGIDYGDRRIGLARSDPTGLIATGYKTIIFKSANQVIDEIMKDIKESGAVGVVVGYPVALSGGNKGERCQIVDQFIIRLQKKYDGPVYKVDERYSSTEAETMIHMHNKKIGRKKERIDRMAAAIILQRFLDESKETN
jgi:putative Holliday junction resolvase